MGTIDRILTTAHDKEEEFLGAPNTLMKLNIILIYDNSM
jgi:hypothetical protein